MRIQVLALFFWFLTGSVFPKIIVSIEANTGAGKSTLIKILEKRIAGYNYIQEPFEEWNNIDGKWNLFQQFVNNQKRWAHTFQTYALFTRLAPYSAANQHDITITERSPFSTLCCFNRMLLDDQTISDLEHRLFEIQTAEVFKHLAYKPTGFIYLKTKAETSFERMIFRNRTFKDGIEMSFFSTLHDYHEKWLINKENIPVELKDVPVLVIDGEVDFINDQAKQNEIVNEVQAFITSLQGALS